MKLKITIPDTPQGLSDEEYHSSPFPQYSADRAHWTVWKQARTYVEWCVKKARARDTRSRCQAEFMLGTYTWAELDIIRDILIKDTARYKGAPQKAITESWT